MANKKGSRQLTWTDRISIEALKKAGHSVIEIAEQLGVHRSTIYNELKRGEYMHRNSDYTETLSYSPNKAQMKAEENLKAISKRYELLGWVTKTKDRYIIEDEYDSELRLNGKPIPSLQSIDVSGKVIYMNTFSKTLCSTVRISYMVLPDELAERFYRELSFYSCTVSNFEQYTLAQFMNSGAFEKHINRLRNYYQQKRDRILEAFLQGVLKTKIKILEEDAGVHFLMKVDTNLSEEEFLDKMKSKGIKLAALSSYYHSSEKKKKYENIYVMNYSFVDCEKMEYVAKMITQVE